MPDVRRRQPRGVGNHVRQVGLGVARRLIDSIDDVKQLLHVAPNTFRTSSTSTSPPRARSRGILVGQQLRRTRSPSCAAQFRPRRGWVPSSRPSCACSTSRRSSRTASTTSRRSAQTRSSARRRGPNELTYSEDWMRPDYIPPQATPAAASSGSPGTGRLAAHRWRRKPRRDESGRWSGRDDGAVRSGVMMRSKLRRACGWPARRWQPCCPARGWHGLNSIPLPGTQGGGPARSPSRRRCPTSPTSSRIPGSASATSTSAP